MNNWYIHYIHIPSMSPLSGASSGICVSSNSGRPVNLSGSQDIFAVGVPGCDVERIAATASAFCCSMLEGLGVVFTANGLSYKTKRDFFTLI